MTLIQKERNKRMKRMRKNPKVKLIMLKLIFFQLMEATTNWKFYLMIRKDYDFIEEKFYIYIVRSQFDINILKITDNCYFTAYSRPISLHYKIGRL